jgi:hypothetical protein
MLTSTLVGGELATSCPGHYNPRERAPVPIGQKVVWALELVWKLWREEKLLAPSGNRTPAVQPVVLPTELSSLLRGACFYLNEKLEDGPHARKT